MSQSWSSLVDKSALEEIPTKERRRQEAIFELITTEAAYVRDLQLIVEVSDSVMSHSMSISCLVKGFLYQPYASTGSEGNNRNLCKRRRYSVDQHSPWLLNG